MHCHLCPVDCIWVIVFLSPCTRWIAFINKEKEFIYTRGHKIDSTYLFHGQHMLHFHYYLKLCNYIFGILFVGYHEEQWAAVTQPWSTWVTFLHLLLLYSLHGTFGSPPCKYVYSLFIPFCKLNTYTRHSLAKPLFSYWIHYVIWMLINEPSPTPEQWWDKYGC